MKVAFTGLLYFYSLTAFSEYRVYQYYVQSKIQSITNAPYEIVTSTLDPKSYLAYHGGKDSLDLHLLRSWMCVGNTSKKEICTISDGQDLEPKSTP